MKQSRVLAKYNLQACTLFALLVWLYFSGQMVWAQSNCSHSQEKGKRIAIQGKVESHVPPQATQNGVKQAAHYVVRDMDRGCLTRIALDEYLQIGRLYSIVAFVPNRAESWPILKGITTIQDDPTSFRKAIAASPRAMAESAPARRAASPKVAAQSVSRYPRPPEPRPKAPIPRRRRPRLNVKIEFTVNSYTIQTHSYALIDQIGEALESGELLNQKLLIKGHTDADGSAEYNLKLSRLRAQSVKEYLLSNFNIQPKRIRSIGLGEAEPLLENISERNKQMNRRVELEIQE